MNQLKFGIKTELEHKKTFDYINKYIKKHKKMPNYKMVATHIARDHLKENPLYYSKIQRYKL